MKKFFILCIMAVIPWFANAYDVQIDGIYYNLTSRWNGAEVTSGSTNYTGSITIPSSIENNGTTIPVTSIGYRAFYGSKSLTAINLPNTIRNIDMSAFNGCSGLTTLIIPSSVTNIYDDSFSYCSNLTSISVDAGNTAYDSRDNCNAIIKTSTNELVRGCKNSIIPNSVVKIGNNSFNNCYDLASINIPISVTSIGDNAFRGCTGLSSVTGGDSVNSIGDYAFSECSNLTSINLGNSLVSIGYRAFLITGLTSISIPSSVTSIGTQAFGICTQLQEVIIPGSVTEIGDSPFYGCNNLARIAVASGNSVFDSRNDCNAIIRTETNELIVGCNNTVTPNTVTSIGSQAFSGLHINNLIIPGSVTCIGEAAFSNIAVGGWQALNNVFCFARDVPETDANAFNGSIDENSVLYVPQGCIDVYSSMEPWNSFGTIKEMTGVIDLTCFVKNASYDNNSYACWSGTSLGGVNPYNNAEHYNKNYNTFQAIAGLPAGYYQVGVQGFYRKGTPANDYALWTSNDTSHDYALLYATSSVDSNAMPLAPASSAARQSSSIQLISPVGDGLYIPNTMAGAAEWFEGDYYHNYVEVEVGEDGKLIIGIKKDQTIAEDWTCIDNWTLHRIGSSSSQLASPDAYYFAAKDIHATTFVATWKGVPRATFYDISVREQGGDYDKPVFKRSTTSTSVEVTGLSPDTYYQFRVRARNGIKEHNSEWSGSIVNAVKTLSAESSPSSLAVHKIVGVDGSEPLVVNQYCQYNVWILNKFINSWKGKVILKEDGEVIHEWDEISLSSNTMQRLECPYIPQTVGNKVLSLYYQTHGVSDEQIVDDGSINVIVDEEGLATISGLCLHDAINIPAVIGLGTTTSIDINVGNNSGNNWAGKIYLVDNGDIVNEFDTTIQDGDIYTAQIQEWTPTVEGTHELSVFYQTAGTDGIYLLDANGFSNPLTVDVTSQVVPLSLTEACMTLITKGCAPAQINVGDMAYYNFRFTDTQGNPIQGIKAHFNCTGSTKMAFIDTPLSNAEGYSTLIINTKGDKAFARPGETVKFACLSLRDVNNTEISIKDANPEDCEFSLKLHRNTIFDGLESFDITLDIGLGAKPKTPKMLSASVDVSFPVKAKFKWDDEDQLTTSIEHEMEAGVNVNLDTPLIELDLGGAFGTKKETTYNWSHPGMTSLGIVMSLIGVDCLYTNKNVLKSILAIEKWFGGNPQNFMDVIEDQSFSRSWSIAGKLSGKKSYDSGNPLAGTLFPELGVPKFQESFKGGVEGEYKHEFGKEEFDFQKYIALYGFSNSLKTKLFCNAKHVTSELCKPTLLNPLPAGSVLTPGGLFNQDIFAVDGYMSVVSEEEEMFTTTSYETLGKISNSLKIEAGYKISPPSVANYICPGWAEANKEKFKEDNPTAYAAYSGGHKWKMTSKGEWAAYLQEMSKDVDKKALVAAVYPVFKGDRAVENPYTALSRYNQVSGQFKIINSLKALSMNCEQYPVAEALKVEEQQYHKVEFGISLPIASWKLFGIGIDVSLDVGFTLGLTHYPSISHYSVQDKRFFSVVTRKSSPIETMCKDVTDFLADKIRQAFSDEDKEDVCVQAGQAFDYQESELRAFVKELSNKNSGHTTTKSYSAKRRAPKLAAFEQKDVCEFTFTLNEGQPNFDEGTMLTSSHYYPLGKLLGVTDEQDTLFVVSEVFEVNAINDADTLQTTQYGTMKLETKIGADDLIPFGFPEDMPLDVYYSGEGSDVWEYVGPAGSVLQVSKLGSYMMATSVKNDPLAPVIEASFSKAMAKIYLNITDNIGIRVNTLKVFINGEIRDFVAVSESNFEVSLSEEEVTQELQIEIYVNDIANNQGTLKQIYNPGGSQIEPEEPAVELTDGTYYLQNIATGKFWGADNSWGTRASLVDEYVTVKLVRLDDGKYTLESMVSNGGSDYYFNGEFMDGQPVALNITPVGNYYTININGQYIGYDGSSTVLANNLTADSENARWKAISQEDMKTKQDNIMAAATVMSPADVTFLIKDPGFGRNRRDVWDAWTINAGNYNLGDGADLTHPNACGESWHSTFTLSQSLGNVPQGVYKLSAQGFYRQDGSDYDHLPYFYVNDVTSTFPERTGSEESMTAAGVSFRQGLYECEPIYIEISESGPMTIGAKLDGNYSLWCIWDNFKLTYYGPDSKLSDLFPSTLYGDVNNDGQVTIADVTALVNIILGKDTAGAYNHAAADVNGDESITIADVTALVNIILGKN